MRDAIRVVVADDHPVVRKGLRAILEEDRGICVEAEAADGESALARISKLAPEVAVIDVDMPRLDGFGVAREVARRGLATRLIFLTLHQEEDLFRAAMDLGVAGYLLKDSAMIEIVAAVQAVAAGRPYVSSDLAVRALKPIAAAAAASATAPAPGLADCLTAAERRILSLIAEGQSSKEIGTTLSIHYRTVENHRTNICRKLGLEGSNALVRFALQNKGRL